MNQAPDQMPPETRPETDMPPQKSASANTSMRTTIIFIVVLTIFAGLLGYNYYFEPFAQLNVIPELAETQEETVLSEAEIAQQQLVALLQALTPQQKIAQLLAVPITIDEQTQPSMQAVMLPVEATPNEDADENQQVYLSLLRSLQPGFVIWFGSDITAEQATQSNTWQNQYLSVDVTTSEADTAPIQLQLATFVDHEGGSVQRLAGEGFTEVPSWQAMCELPSIERERQFQLSAQELSEVGVVGVFGPVLDLGPSAVLNTRVCSEDPETVTAISQEMIGIYQENGVYPVVKHFPGIGSLNVDLHQQFDAVEVSTASATIFTDVLDSSNENDLPVGIMASHAGLQQLDPDLPCSLNPNCVGQLAKAYPESLIFTDEMSMGAVLDALSQVESDASSETEQATSLDQFTTPTPSELTLIALQAGNHVVLWGQSLKTDELQQIISDLVSVYETDQSFQQLVDERVENVLQFKQKYGLVGQE